MTFKERVSKFPTIHLTYCIIPLVSIFIEQSPLPMFVTISIWILFMVTTALLTMLKDDEIKRYLHIILILHCLCIILLACYVNPSIVILFVFLTFYLPNYVFNSAILVLVSYYFFSLLIVLLFTYLTENTLLIYVVFLELILTISFVVNLKNKEKQILTQKLHQQKRQINQLMAEQERQRIAQDLHDTLGHVFASISIKSELAQKLCLTDPSKACIEMKEVQTISKETLNQVRKIVDNVHWITFMSEVKRMSHLLKESHIEFIYSGTECVENIPIEKQTSLAMILREAMNNVIKHSNATCVSLDIQRIDNNIYFRIYDNGCVMPSQPFEVKSIQERVDALNGQLTISSSYDGVVLLIVFDMEGFI
ncbi:sensor histidine kinase [Staphylococcus agnetis]|uniref:sensor histidine kinase n=1 Tax=Staphylococcus agnetis TaxID=985762 RepID=UPI001676B2C1|nr:sensor histidine kinase [Staphylococcus agnetis]